MAKVSKREPDEGQGRWAFLDRPLVTTLISTLAVGGVLAFGMQFYRDHQASVAEHAVRREALGKLLSEYDQRMAYLSNADDELDFAIGPAPGRRSKVGPVSGDDQRWGAAQVRASREESDALLGRGSYVPTSPEFAGVHLLTVMTEIDSAAGLPGYDVNAYRLFGGLNAPSEVTWLWIRAFMPKLKKFSVVTGMLYTDGELPLARGQALTERQERMFGIPTGTPAQIEAQLKQARAEADRLAPKSN